jgi:hypothetical protein
VCQEFFFGDDTLTVLQEVQKHLEHFGLDGNRLPSSTQLTALRVEFIVSKAVEHRPLLTDDVVVYTSMVDFYTKAVQPVKPVCRVR